jgi:hypothetical protein
MQRISSLTTAATLLLALALPAGAQAATDRNHDRIPDRWERAHHLSLRVNQARRDQDRDGLVSRSEYLDHTNPRRRDSDRDGTPDGREDADHDGISNGAEQEHGTSGDEPTRPPRPEPVVSEPDGSGDGAALGDGDEAEPTTETPRPVPPPPPAPPAAPAAPASTGTVTTVGDGSITITRPSGEVVPGFVRASTVLRCIRVAAGYVVSNEPCSTSHLVVGRQVALAQRTQVDGGWAWASITLIEPTA